MKFLLDKNKLALEEVVKKILVDIARKVFLPTTLASLAPTNNASVATPLMAKRTVRIRVED